VREEVEGILRSLTVDELLEARRLVETVLSRLEATGRGAPLAPEGIGDRRHFSRYLVSIPVTYFRHGGAQSKEPGGLAAQDGVVRDISRNGIRFFTNERLEPNEVLTLYLPGPLGVRKLFVETMRVERRGQQYECGASFVGLDRVFAAQRAEEQRSEVARVLVVCEPCPEREALSDLLVKQGYTAHMANTVPEALAMLELHRCTLVVASAPMLLAEDERLLKHLDERRGDVLSAGRAGATRPPLGAAISFKTNHSPPRGALPVRRGLAIGDA